MTHILRREIKMSIRKTALLFLWLTLAMLIAGCNFPLGQTPTPDPAALATLAAHTVEAVLTQAALGTQPPSAPSAEPTRSSTTAPSPALSPPSNTKEPQCSNQALFIDDVTIPDNSTLAGGQSFVKIWRFKNSGTCCWSRTYSLIFIGGELMDAETVIPLISQVYPDADVDLAVDMIAPEAPGIYRGFWKLRSPEGIYFGIGPAGDQSFWVKIEVTAPPSATPTITFTPTETSTATPDLSATTTDTPIPSDTPTQS